MIRLLTSYITYFTALGSTIRVDTCIPGSECSYLSSFFRGMGEEEDEVPQLRTITTSRGLFYDLDSPLLSSFSPSFLTVANNISDLLVLSCLAARSAGTRK